MFCICYVYLCYLCVLRCKLQCDFRYVCIKIGVIFFIMELVTYRLNLFFKLYNYIVQMTISNLTKHKSTSLNNKFNTYILKHHRPSFFNIRKFIYIRDISNYIIFIYQEIF